MCAVKSAEWTMELIPAGKLVNSGATINMFKVEPPMVSDWTGEAYSTVQVTETTTPSGQDETHIMGVHGRLDPRRDLGDDIHVFQGRDFVKALGSMGYFIPNIDEAILSAVPGL